MSLLVLYFRCFPVRKGEFVCGYSVTCVQHILHYKCDIYNASGHFQTFNICSNTTASHSLRNYSYLCISVKYLSYVLYSDVDQLQTALKI